MWDLTACAEWGVNGVTGNWLRCPEPSQGGALTLVSKCNKSLQLKLISMKLHQADQVSLINFLQLLLLLLLQSLQALIRPSLT